MREMQFGINAFGTKAGLHRIGIIDAQRSYLLQAPSGQSALHARMTLPLVIPRGSSNLLSVCRLAVLAALFLATLGARATGEATPSTHAAIGHVDAPTDAVISDPKTVVSGWSLSKRGVARVEVVIDGRERINANLGVERSDVKAAHPDYPENDKAGFDAKVDLSNLAMGRHEIAVVATDREGRTTVLGRRIYVNPSFRSVWAGLLAARGHRVSEKFYFVFATSHVADGGGAEIDTEYAPFLSETMKVGVRVPILYMRTTRGRNGDWTFDPDFDISRNCGV